MLQNSGSSDMVPPEYVTALENRVRQLEDRLQQFERQLSQQQADASKVRTLPDTSLLSPSFLTRAFAAWGHVVVAQLIIVVPLYCLIFIIAVLSNH